MTWSLSFSSLLLCNSEVCKLCQLQSRNTQSCKFTQSHVPDWFTYEGVKHKNFWQKEYFSRQNFVLFRYQAFKLAHFNLGWCRNWRFTVRFCSTIASEKTNVPEIDHTLLSAASESPTLFLSQNQRQRKPGPFQNMNIRSCNYCTHKVLQLIGLCKTQWKLAGYQHRKLDNFCIQNLPVHNLLSPRLISGEWSHSPGWKMDFGVWIWHMLIN